MGKKKKIKILAPVDKLHEVPLLIDEGATELYGGMFPSYFAKYPFFLSPNQRTFKEAQMDEDEFADVVAAGKKRKTPVYLTINQLYFIEEQIPLIIRMALDAEKMSVDGLIMGSVPLILHIKKAGVKTPIHLSTMGVALNHIAVGFFSDLGVRRVTLPRSLLISEVKEIIKKNRKLDFDSFILVGKCPNIEGFCTFLHTNPDKIWPCEQGYDISSRLTVNSSQQIMADGREIASRTSSLAPRHLFERAVAVQRQWQGFPRSHGCGICAVPDLLRAGVTGLKIVGRGSSTSFKVKNIGLLKGALRLFWEAKGNDRKRDCENLKALYTKVFSHPCTPFTCYYPDGRF